MATSPSKNRAPAVESLLDRATPERPSQGLRVGWLRVLPGWNDLADTVRREGTGRTLRRVLAFLGPAFLVSVGYMDPGNWATDLEGGARFNYNLLWVLLLSNLMAILLQSLSAKLGIATGKDLAQLCRERFPRPVAVFLWATAEIAMMATDLAEFLGSAIGLSLLFNLPLLTATLITGLDVFLILGLQHFGFRKVEYAIFSLIGVVGVTYLIEIWLSRPDWGALAYSIVVPRLDSESIYVAIGMLGATVMPHNLYLHSHLIQTRVRPEDPPRRKRNVFRLAVLDSTIALNAAFFVNGAILVMAAAVFFRNGLPVASIEQAHQTLVPLLGPAAGFAFAIALLASGVASSTTATLAGQVVMEGFLHVRVRPWLRRFIFRLLVMIPAVLAVALRLDPLNILVLSQASLSFQLPFASIPLLIFTADRRLMGEFVNRRWTTLMALVVIGLILFLNGLLIYRLFGGQF